MEKSTSEFEIWHKIVKKLNEQRIDYILVGAAALVIHGLPRSTLDIDIYIKAERENLTKLFKMADSLELHSEQKSILNIGHSPQLFVNQWICFSYEGQDILDVFLSEKDEFDRLYKNSQQKQDKKLCLRVASLEDIIAMKKKSGRAIDLADIELIQEMKKYKEGLS